MEGLEDVASAVAADVGLACAQGDDRERVPFVVPDGGVARRLDDTHDRVVAHADVVEVRAVAVGALAIDVIEDDAARGAFREGEVAAGDAVARRWWRRDEDGDRPFVAARDEEGVDFADRDTMIDQGQPGEAERPFF